MKAAANWPGVFRQEERGACSPVAIVNALRWLGRGYEPSLETLKKQTRWTPDGADYRDAVGYLADLMWVDSWCVSLYWHGWTVDVARELTDGSVCLLGVDSDHFPGEGHAVVLVDVEGDELILLDGRADAPLRWTLDQLKAHHVHHPTVLRHPKWLNIVRADGSLYVSDPWDV